MKVSMMRAFFFSRSPNHRYLHSFPTRRSSDLPRVRPARSHAEAGARPAQLSLREVSRSEEHTSELQSLRQLVCRLLLEKKKRGTLCVIARWSVPGRRT